MPVDLPPRKHVPGRPVVQHPVAAAVPQVDETPVIEPKATRTGFFQSRRPDPEPTPVTDVAPVAARPEPLDPANAHLSPEAGGPPWDRGPPGWTPPGWSKGDRIYPYDYEFYGTGLRACK